MAIEAGAFREITSDQIKLSTKIGQGITAVVYKGTLSPSNEPVAVKQINWDKSTVAAAQQSAIERELAIMTRVSHPNLVRFLGVMSLQKPFSIITEFCEGGCLFNFLYNSRGDPDEIELAWRGRHKMCLDVAHAMHYLHSFSPQIVHRDLKSLNLLLLQRVTSTEDIPHLKVADFGLSRMQDQASDWSKMTQNAGTSFWMAPEVVRGTSYNEKVDIYSYSMVLFEIICREIPFEDIDPGEIGDLVVTGNRPDLEAVPEDCPDFLRTLMIGCWAQDSSTRPGFAEILEVLKQS